MQIEASLHYKAIILPAIKAYEDAEADLTLACRAESEAVDAARYAALRQGGAAAFYLHHFADIMANRPTHGFPNFNGDIKKVRELLISTSIEHMGRSDVSLLGDVADALKHSVLTHSLPREVENAGQVLAIERNYGTGIYGQGKYGGKEEVWVFARSGKRSLISVLSSVSSVWSILLSGQACT